MRLITFIFFFFFNDPATPEIYTLSLHDALPILFPHRGARAGARGGAARRERAAARGESAGRGGGGQMPGAVRSEEHTSELQSRFDLVCRLLLEKKKKKIQQECKND